MATRLQSIAFGLGSAKQADIDTASATYNRFRQISSEVPALVYGTESDKDEIGKGNEFISQVFATAWGATHQLSKFSSAEFTLWAWAYALGNVALSSGLYTINPLDPATSLQLPYTSLVAQLGEGGGSAIDEVWKGVCVGEVTTDFHYGPGRASSNTNVSLIGSGRHTFPSGITLPTTLTEFGLKSQSMAITINGVDYVAGSPGAKTILMGSMSWQNNLLTGIGHRPGSGLVNNASVMADLLFGNRVPTLNFTAFLTKDSLEQTKLIAQTTNTATITLTYDATHFVTWTYPSVSFESVTRSQEEGLVAVNIVCAPKWDGTKVLTVTGKCALTDIAQ